MSQQLKGRPTLRCIIRNVSLLFFSAAKIMFLNAHHTIAITQTYASTIPVHVKTGRGGNCMPKVPELFSASFHSTGTRQVEKSE